MSKPEKPYRKRAIGDRQLQPESLVMGYGYDPHLSEGSIKPPIFQTSTFAFKSAEEGEAAFSKLGGRAYNTEVFAEPGLIYSRMNNPDLEVLEDRLTLYDGAEAALAFSSGMGAITTALLTFLDQGKVVLHSSPLYGATETFIRNTLPRYGVETEEFFASAPESEIRDQLKKAKEKGQIAVIYTETPANPTNDLVDLELMVKLADELEKEQGLRPVIMTDNTFLGPVDQTPISLGVDLVLYSLTKYFGGHSDLVAGGCLGSSKHIGEVHKMRSALGTNADPHTCWLLMRSLETLKLRMSAAADGARACANFLKDHPKVEKVRYLDFLDRDTDQGRIYDSQCRGPGSTFSFDVKGGQEAAFRLLNALTLVKLAVSLGGTESLACHPGSTTHSAVDPDLRERLGFTPGLVRLSVGVENPDDLIADLDQALKQV